MQSFLIVLLCGIALLAGLPARAQSTLPIVAIHDSELTRALDSTNSPASGATPSGAGTTGLQWWTTNWHYFVMPESLKEAFRSDGTAFTTIGDSNISAGVLLLNGQPRYPIVFSLASEAIRDDEIAQFTNYVAAGGFLFVGASSFTRNTNGTSRGNFAMASQMGVSMVTPSLQNWIDNGPPGQNSTFTRASNHRLVSHIPTNAWVNWNMPSSSEEVSWGKFPRTGNGDNSRPYLSHFIWNVSLTDATAVGYGNTRPYLTIKPYGKGYFIYYAPMQGLLGHGGWAPGMYIYTFFRRAVEWSFESAQIPVPKVSPWPYSYNAALMVRHDIENYADQITGIEASALAEWTNGAFGDYYFCANTLGRDMPTSNAVIASIRRAITNYGATVLPHNGGLPNPNASIGDYTNYNYWHWGPDEALDGTFPGYANGKAYALHSLSNSFISFETWFPGLVTNGMRGWCSPYFNATREDSYEIQSTLNVKINGEQKISPFPHWTLSTRTPNKRYGTLSQPVSDWFIPQPSPNYQEIAQRMEDVPSFTNVHAMVDFYYDMGALINFYSHMLSSTNGNVHGGGTSTLPLDYIQYTLNTNFHPRVWSANAISVYDWWLQRSNVQINATYTTNSGQTNIILAVSGAQRADTAVEILLPGTNGVPCLSVYTNGVLAGPSVYRIIGQTVRVQVGTTVSSVQFTYGCGFGFSQNFDGVTAPSLPPGWTTSATGSQANWYTTNSIVDSSPNAAFSGGANNVGVSELVSPTIALPNGQAKLRFRNHYNTQTNRDGGVLEIKIGTNAFADIITAGGSWVTGGYNSTISSSFSSPIGGRSAWSGNSGGYITTEVNLPVGAASQLIQFKWRFATDNANSSAGWRVDTIAFPNTAPVLLTQTNRTLAELTMLLVTNLATDVEAPPQTLSYQLLSPPAGAVITNGVIAWFITEAQGPGNYDLTTVVTDDGVPALTATNTFTVTVTEANTAPSLPAQSNRATNELSTLVVVNTATDNDLPAQSLNYTLAVTNLGNGLQVTGPSISSQGVITWVTTEAHGPSTNRFTTRVNDGTASATNVFDVVVNEVNATPVLPAQSNRTAPKLVLMTVTNTATDTDLPPNVLTYTLAVTNTITGVQVTNAAIDVNGIITWTPTALQDPSTNEFTTRVADNGSPILRATNKFTVIVNSQPHVGLSSTTLTSETCFPTNNAIDNGETVTLSFSFSNTGFGNTTNLVVTLLNTNGITGASAAQNYGVLAAGGAAVARSFSFSAASACGSNITATLQLQDGDADLGLVGVSFPLGTLGMVLTQNFDSVTIPALPVGAGWSTTFSGLGMIGWFTTNNADTAPNAVFSRDAANVASNLLISPPVVLPYGSNQLRFRQNYLLEANASVGYDGGVLDIKIGAGPWQDILAAGGSFVSGGYNRTIDTEFFNPISGRQAWSDNSGGYITTLINLPASSAGQTIQLRWVCGTDNGTTAGGWRIDSIGIIGRVCCANATPILPSQNNRTVDELSLLSVTNTALDPGLPVNSLNYSLTVTNLGTGLQVTNASISPAGVITWTPTEAQGPGTNLFTTIAVNSGVLSLAATNTFTVVVNEANVAPTLPVQSNRSIAELGSLTVTNTASDSDVPANTLNYTLSVTNLGTGQQITNASMDADGVITWTPSEAQGPSTNRFVTIVSDGSANATNSFDVVVTEVNVAPVLGTLNPVSLAEGTTLQVTNSATDSDLPANVLSYQLIGAPGYASIDGLGVISLAPLEADGPVTNTFATVVSDGSASATNFLTVTVTEVNVAPVLPVQNNRTNAELTTLSVTNTASDSDVPANTLNYTLSVTNLGTGQQITNASIAANGVITWTPTEVQGPSTNRFVTIVSDGSVSATNSFDVVVTEVNVAPVLGVLSPVNLAEGATLQVTNSATDSDLPANTLSYQLIGAPGYASISALGVISLAPVEADGPVTNTFATVVNDGLASATNFLTVTVTEVNVAPVLPVQSNRTNAELTTLSVTNTASDSDVPANTLNYTLSVTNLGTGQQITNASITANGVITWTPTEAQGPSTNRFVTIVSDGSASATNSFEVVVTEVNSAPVLGVLNPVSLAEGSSLQVTNSATDSDLPANVLSYQLIGAPGYASINSLGVISLAPVEADGPATNTFATVVSDGLASATNFLTVTVTEMNVAPVLPVQSNRTNAELTTLSVTNTASDSDMPANALNYTLSVTNLGTGQQITNASIAANGVITWTPSEAQGPSTNRFVTIVNDGNATATNSFDVVVTEVNVAPVLGTLNSVSLAEGSSLQVTNSATDSDLPANTLSYQLIGAPGYASINSLGVISLAPLEADGPVTNTFATVVSDGLLSATNFLTVTVTEVNVAPVLGPLNPVTLDEGATLQVTNSATDSDLPANALSYQLIGAPGYASINAAGVISLVPLEADGPATNTFATVVSDGLLSTTNFLTVTVAEVNVAPVLGTLSPVSLAEGTILQVTNSATDSDLPANTLTYQLVGAPGYASINSVGVISLAPLEADGPATNTFTTVVSDGLASATNFLIVTVTEVNVAPVLPVQTNRTIAELTSLNVTNTASDSDVPANVLNYTMSVTNLGTGEPITNANLDVNGVITWTPTEAQGPSTNRFVTIVNDGNASATNSFDVVVTEVNIPPILPEQADVTIAALSNLSVTNTATDVDLPANALSYSLLIAPLNAGIDTFGVITWTPTEAQSPSTNTFTTMVSDGIASATNTFVVIVTNVPIVTAPIIQSISVTNDVATVSWSTVEGRSYRLQFRDDVAGTIWTNVVPDVLGNGGNVTGTNLLNGTTQRFFRVMLVPGP